MASIKEKTETLVGKTGLTLIDDWHKFYKMYSIWFFTLLGLTPDIYNLAVTSAVIDAATAPPLLVRIVNGIAFAGAVGRLVKQKKLEQEPAQTGGEPPTPPVAQ